jgi:WD40 repeat protein
LENFDRICKSPSQIYHFALPFSPSSSWLQKCYGVELSHTIRVVKGLSSDWGSCSRTVSLRSAPISLSYCKNTIAVGCLGPDIIILDAITGNQMAVLSGHTDWVRSVTFSLDGRSLASGSNDRTVKLWDVQTGCVVKTFHSHNHFVYSVSISGNYTWIASGSGDETICLWDIQTGECLHAIKQQNSVEYVSFSPTNPQHILSISGRRVWSWDLIVRKLLV